MPRITRRSFAFGLASLPLFRVPGACAQAGSELSEELREIVVRRAYQYVAMYNTNNNFAMQKRNPFSTHGWNKMFVPTGLTDHTLTAIPRPNNDTLYLISMLDMRDDAIVIDFPAFESKYVSLECSAYDHYIDIPLATNKGDFKKRTKMLFYTERTKGYKGETVAGVDKTLKMTGDFAIAFLRIAPQAAEPDKYRRNLAAMQTQKLMTLSEFQGKPRKPRTPLNFPKFSNDEAVFKHNFLEVMQFVFNYTTFDPSDPMDQEILSAMKPLGVAPGRTYDPQKVANVDGNKLAETAERVLQESLRLWNDPKGNPYLENVFQPKGRMTLGPMTLQSAVGPIGLPYDQAQYPGIGTADGSPIMAHKHYVVRMTKDELPPARAFWSLTLYIAKTGLFVPNDGKKYSVGENGGMKLDPSGGIEVHVAPTQPPGVPKENWLPSGGKDEALDIIMRVYDPDVEAMRKYKTPKVMLA